MSGPEMDFARYLRAKRSVDDRALNQGVWHALMAALTRPRQGPLRVLEIGAGLCAMLSRALERGLAGEIHYTALDQDQELLARAPAELTAWAQEHGWRARERAQGLNLSGRGTRVSVELLAGDLLNFFPGPRQWDLVMAHAFLDLVDLEPALARCFGLCRAGGLCYFSLVFDGLTVFLPANDPEYEERLLAAYHVSMDRRGGRLEPGKHSHSGRRLLAALMEQGAHIIQAGPSDWLVHPPYQFDEAYFLRHMLHFVEESLGNDPDMDQGRLREWLQMRREQIERSELIFMAHQIDVLCRPPE